MAFVYGTLELIVIPESLRSLLLRDLHAEHLGMVKMKQLTPKYLWWPGLDKEIEETLKLANCQETAERTFYKLNNFYPHLFNFILDLRP